MDGETSGAKKQSWGDKRRLKKLGPQHHLLIELAAQGCKTGRIADELEMTVSHVSTLLSNTEIKQRIRERREQFFDGKFEERLNQLMPRILSLAEDVINDESIRPALRVNTGFRLMERLYGKPKQQVEVGSGNLLSQFIAALERQEGASLGPAAPESQKSERDKLLDELIGPGYMVGRRED